jgi:Flp pilus assembly protein TadG
MKRGRCRGDGGDSGPLEAVILMPVLLAVFALLIAFGRTTTAGNDVEHAARVGARAATGAQTMGGAQERASTVVRRSLANSGLSCASHDVGVSGAMRPGGRITVSVSCVVDLGDVTELGPIPGSRTLRASATEIIDVIRGGGS